MDMHAYFQDLGRKAFAGLAPDESATLHLSGETTDFVRFNRGRYRQAGRVAQDAVDARLRRGAREVEMRVGLSGRLADDAERLAAAFAHARTMLGDLPDNPYLQPLEKHADTMTAAESVLPATADLVQGLLDRRHPGDFVGIVAAGATRRGFMSSLGQTNWHATASFNVDASLHGAPGQAVKLRHAGRAWEADAFDRLYAKACEDFAGMGRPMAALKPGKYRVYLAPTALEDIFENVGGGFGAESVRTKNSPLTRLVSGEAVLDPGVALSENAAAGIAPNFSREGVPKPGVTRLVADGRWLAPLVSAKSAREYGLPPTGAGAGEAPESLEMAAGDLPQDEALAAVGDGLYINNLWYLNYSDRGLCRMTGLTRFANFVVRDGKAVAPMPVMRFDESLFHMLGTGLQGVTRERRFIASAQTYGERSLSSMTLPGIVVDGFTLTF